jgi:hypothetical protein
MITLGRAQDGRLVLATNQPMPADIGHIEYYREQRLFMAVYENGDSDLMPCEIAPDIAHIVESSPDIMIVAVTGEGQEPMGYDVSLIQIGV